MFVMSRCWDGTLNRWRPQYGGMKADKAKRLKNLDGENQRLKSWSLSSRWTSRRAVSRASQLRYSCQGAWLCLLTASLA